MTGYSKLWGLGLVVLVRVGLRRWYACLHPQLLLRD